MKPSLLLALLLAALAVAAQQEIITPAESPAFVLELERPEVRVFRLEIAPGEETGEHVHQRDFVLVALTEGRLLSTIGDRTEEQSFVPGQMQVASAGFPHGLRNAGDSPFRAVLVELSQPINERQIVCGLGRAECGAELGGITENRYSISTLAETDALRIATTEMEGETETIRHEHSGPHLAIAITDLELTSNVTGGEARTIEQQAGQIAWVPGGFGHKLINLRAEPAKWVSIEFK